MARTARSTRTDGPTITLRDLPAPDPALEVVFVTNAVRRRGGLRTRGERHRPMLAAVVD